MAERRFVPVSYTHLNDFKNVFTFDEAFVKPFEPRNSATTRRTGSTAKVPPKRANAGSKKKNAGSL